jgi:hypothetical protein
MPIIPLNFTQIAQDIDRKVRELAMMKAETLSQTESFLINQLKQNAHVWQPNEPRTKPHMRDTIKRERAGNNYRIVTVSARYSAIENARSGSKATAGYAPHNFGDRSFATTVQVFDPKIKAKINRIITGKLL